MIPRDLKIRGRQFQRVGRGFDVILVFPKDRGAALGRNDGVNSIFHHQDTVADTDSQRAATSSLANNADNDRDLQPRHFSKVVRDSFRLTSFLGPTLG